MEKILLSMDDFAEYLRKRKLGKIYFPNGKNFNIKIKDLCDSIRNLKNQLGIPYYDIQGVINFGSSIKYPSSEKNPNDVDFLVLTSGIYSIKNYNLRNGKIHLISAGIEQIKRYVMYSDHTTNSIFQEGISIVGGREFEYLRKIIGVEKTNPMGIYWDENKKGVLNGVIR